METKMKMTKSQERAVACLKHEIDKYVGDGTHTELKEWNVKCDECRFVVVNALCGRTGDNSALFWDNMQVFIGTHGGITYYVHNGINTTKKRLTDYNIHQVFCDQSIWGNPIWRN